MLWFVNHARTLVLSAACIIAPCLNGATYYVDGTVGEDSAVGSKRAPWKTLTRAGTASELEPGDTVVVRSGVYREEWKIRVKGERDRPIAFRASGEVIVSAAETLSNSWERGVNSFRCDMSDSRFWKNSRYPDGIPPTQRHVSMLVRDGVESYRLLGSHGLYSQSEFNVMGSDVSHVVERTFFYDKENDHIYVASGPPHGMWEIGVRPSALDASGSDYELDGFVFRGPNRQVGKQWSLCNVNGERWVLKRCKFLFADYVGLSHYRASHGRVIECEIAHNECQGQSIQESKDISVTRCWIHHNGHGPFTDSWGVRAGVKYIPYNSSVSINYCLVEQNGGNGIWFDTCSENCSATGNIVRFNTGHGIHFEISGGHFTADANVIYRNAQRGIYLRGTPNCNIFGNTVVENWEGIVVTPDSGGTRVERNTVSRSIRGDMVLWEGTSTAQRNRYQKDVKLFNGWGRQLAWDQWRRIFDKHSKIGNLSLRVEHGRLKGPNGEKRP